jgi:AcrR family transcriptional regulator
MYRELVFESAEHVIAEQGLEATTMQEIAAEAGISLRTLYAAFPSKEELVAEVQRVRGEGIVAQISEAIDAAPDDPLARLEGGVRGYVEFLLAHPSFLRIHLREGRTWGLEPKSGGEREGWRLGLGRFAAILGQGMQQGLFHQGDPEFLALLGAAVMQVHMAHIALATPKDADALSAEILLQLHRLFCKPGVGRNLDSHSEEAGDESRSGIGGGPAARPLS